VAEPVPHHPGQLSLITTTSLIGVFIIGSRLSETSRCLHVDPVDTTGEASRLSRIQICLIGFCCGLPPLLLAHTTSLIPHSALLHGTLTLPIRPKTVPPSPVSDPTRPCQNTSDRGGFPVPEGERSSARFLSKRLLISLYCTCLCFGLH
jgi:hypothetical protein